MIGEARNNRTTVYLVYIFLAIVIYYILCALSGGYYFSSVFFGDTIDSFADFFKCVYSWSGNPYEEGICNYPAFGVLMFKIVHEFLPASEEQISGLAYRGVQSMNIIFILYNLVTFWLVMISMSKILNITRINKNLLYLIVLLSMPVMFSIERGNQINISFALTFFFIAYYKSENIIIKESAIIALAMAACLKIYPAVFGFLLIIKKDWKGAIKSIIYGIVLFIIPFLYYGISSLSSFVSSLTAFSGNRSVIIAYNYSLKNILAFMCDLFGISLNTTIFRIVMIVLIALLLLASLLSKHEWIQCLSLGLLLIMVPPVSDAYTLLFLIPAFVLMVNEYNEYDKEAKFEQEYLDIIKINFFFILVPWASPIIEQLSYLGYKMSYANILYWIIIITMILLQSCYAIHKIKEYVVEKGFV